MKANQERLELMIDGISALRSVGLEPTGFKMNADLLEKLLPYEKRAKVYATDEYGVVDVEQAMSEYQYEIMGIPIAPVFGESEIKVTKKVRSE